MFVTDKAYLEAVKNVIRSNNKKALYLAVAFWGKGAELLFKELPECTKEVRVICNLTSGGTNPQAIRKLQALGPKVTVRQLNQLHAKVVCGDEMVVIGSANVSSNGLALQGEQCAGWFEAGLVTETNEVLRPVRSWLDTLWQKAREIKEADLTLAQANWERRRAVTNKEDDARFIFDERFSKDYWEGKKVFLGIYCSHASRAAEQQFKDIQQREEINLKEKFREASVLNFYEQWPDLPTDAVIIDVWYRKIKKTAEVESECYRRIPVLDVAYFKTEKGEDSSLQIVQIVPDTEFKFGEREVKAIEEKLNEKVKGETLVQRLWESRDKGESALVVPFSQLFDSDFEASTSGATSASSRRAI